MDLISTLSQQLGIEPTQAQSLAGGLMSLVKSQVAASAGPDTAEQVRTAIPESSVWEASAPTMPGDLSAALGSLLGGGTEGSNELLSAMGAMLGQQGGQVAAQAMDFAALGSLLSRLGIGPEKLQVILPSLLSFLAERLPPELLGAITSAMPMLRQEPGAEGTPSIESLAGMLGGILK